LRPNPSSLLSHEAIANRDAFQRTFVTPGSG